MSTPNSKKLPLYEKIAEHFQTSIVRGSLIAGDKMPSLRHVKDQFQVSLTTAIEAYHLLEDMGYIESRPRSAYLVKAFDQNQIEEPRCTQPSLKPCYVKMLDSDIMMDALTNEDFVQLGAAVCESDLFPEKPFTKIFRKSLQNIEKNIGVYPPISGEKELEKQICIRMRDASIDVSPKDVMITNGANEAVFLALSAITKPGDVVAIESPCYFSGLEMTKALHLKVLELPTDPKCGIDLTVLERRMKQGQIKACMLMANYINPLGSIMPDKNKKTLVNLLNRYEIPAIEDDVYGDFVFNGTRPRALKSFDKKGWVIYCNSFSKSLCPGLRMGWCVPGRFYNHIWHLKRLMNISTASAPQMALADYLKSHAYTPHIKSLRQTLRKNTSILRSWVAQNFPQGTKITNPQGGHVLWVECDPELDSEKLFHEALKHNITIAPGTLFSASNQYRHCFRLNTGNLPTPKILKAVKILAKLIHKQIES